MIPRKVWIYLGLAVLAMSMSLNVARADVITFSGLSGANLDPFPASYTEGNFTVTPLFGAWFQGQIYGNPVPSIVLGPVFTPRPGAIQVTGTGNFTWSSLDYSSNNGSSLLTIQGSVGGVTQFTENALVNNACAGVCAFSTLLGADSSTVIDELAIVVNPTPGGPTSINLDNIVVSLAPVPEPSSLLLLAAGLVGLMIGYRKMLPTLV